MTKPIYKNPTKPVDERVRDLISRMSVEEKIAQLTAVWLHLDPESERSILSDKKSPDPIYQDLTHSILRQLIQE